MITTNQIEDWIREIEERPSSAPLILRLIFKQLHTLTDRNDQLLSENILLRSKQKIDEYEQRINNLEFQLDLLKRQIGQGLASSSAQTDKSVSLILYDIQGNIARSDFPHKFNNSIHQQSKLINGINNNSLRILITDPTEELLSVFDSGRTENFPASRIPVQEYSLLNWEKSLFIEPRGSEQLSSMLPIGKMTIYDYCTQVSRRGCVRNILLASFASHVSKNYTGTGIKQRPDQTCSLLLTNKKDQIILATREGYLTSISVDQLGFSAEEIIRLSTTDYIQTASVSKGEKYIVVVTDNGKIIQRDHEWIESSDTSRSKGQSVFSQARRDAGTRIAGLAVTNGDNWIVFLLSNGEVRFLPVNQLFATGTVGDLTDGLSVIDCALIN